MTRKEMYEIYCEMFEKCHEIRGQVRKVLESKGYKVYTCDVFVGNEENRQYMVYFEYSKDTPETYHFNRGLCTEEQIKRMYH